MNRTTLSISLLAGAVGLSFGLPASAVTQGRAIAQTGANMCTLSIPTVDTKVRPKATGFRNEGTTNAFVICAFDTPPGGQGPETSEFSLVGMLLKSLDGANHDVTCTGVNSLTDGEVAGLPEPTYVAKTVTVNDTGTLGTYGTTISWASADFGGTTFIPYSAGLFSITCILPPQVSIKVGVAQSEEDVGN